MFTTLNQSLAFHQSPEAFISSRLQELSAKNPNSLPSLTGGANISRASILNRQVHIVSSHEICSAILNSDSDQGTGSIKAMSPTTRTSRLFSAGPAYRELMKDWFGEDSILLEDGPVHTQHKEAWRAQIASLHTDLEPQLRETTRAFLAREFQPGKRINLYETLKTLAWELLLGAFLGPDNDSDAKSSTTHAKVEALQELLLRGQFSLFPVSLNTFFYQSPRSRGLHARAQLQGLLSARIRGQTACPLLRKGDIDRDDIARHSLLFTSSIANKAVASLMTASVMNVFLMPGGDLAGLLRGSDGDGRRQVLRSVLRETERLSPPVVGVMRRVEEEAVLNDGADEVGEGHVVSKGHDVWMYFVGASRDESVFEDAQMFRFDRFVADDAAPQGFAFGDGGKACLGRDVARLMVSIVVDEMLDADFELHGEPQSEGVQAWLGWKAPRGAEAFARDLKQLPCQRPRRPVWVEVAAKGQVREG